MTVTFDGETFDIGGNFSSNTFTAPVDGIYLFGAHLDFDNLDKSSTQILLRIVQVRGASTFITHLDQKDPNEYASDLEHFGLNGSTLMSLAANDEISLAVYQSGGAAISDIGASTRFWGTMIN